MKNIVLICIILFISKVFAVDLDVNNQVILRSNFYRINTDNPFLIDNVPLFTTLQHDANLLSQQYLIVNDNLSFKSQQRFIFDGYKQEKDINNKYHTRYGLNLDELYLQSVLNNLEINLGRKKLGKQFAFFDSAINVLSRFENSSLDYFDRKIELSGQDGIFIDVFQANTLISFGFIPKFQLYDKALNSYYDAFDDIKVGRKQYSDAIKDTYFLRLDRLFDNLNLDLSVLYKKQENIDTTEQTLALAMQKTIMDNLIIYNENSFIKLNNYNSKYVVGLNYSFINQLNIIVEFLHQQQGLSSKNYRELQNHIDSSQEYEKLQYLSVLYQNNNFQKLRKNYLSTRVTKTIMDIDLYTNFIKSIDDKSLNIMFGFKKQLDNIEIKTDFLYFTHNKRSENLYLPYSQYLNLQLKYLF